MALIGDIAEDAARLRKLLRDARKLAKRMERTVRAVPSKPCWCGVPEPPKAPEPPTPRWLLNAAQLQAITKRLNLAEAGTYVAVAKELGIEGDLYEMIAETFDAACRTGVIPDRTDPGAKGKWLESYRDAKSAYAWHRAVADCHANREKEGPSTDD